MFRQKNFLKFYNSASFIEHLVTMRTARERDIRGKHAWEPFIRFKEEFDNEKVWSTWKGAETIPQWLIDETVTADVLNNSDGRKIDGLGIIPLGWSIDDHDDWDVKPTQPYQTLATSEYAADSYEVNLTMSKNKDDFLKLIGDPCKIDVFRVNTYNGGISKEFITQYKSKKVIPDIRIYSTFTDNEDYDVRLWEFIHAKINKQVYTDNKIFKPRHQRQQEIVDNRFNLIKSRIMKGKRAIFWDWITGRVGKCPMDAATGIRVIQDPDIRAKSPELTNCDTMIVLHAYHNRQVLVQNENSKQSFLRGSGIYPQTLVVSRASLQDPINAPYPQFMKAREIADEIIKAVTNKVHVLNIPYLYHHSTILNEALKLIKKEIGVKPFMRLKDELDWPIGSVDSRYRPGYDINYMDAWIDTGSTATKIEGTIVGMSRRNIVGPMLSENTVTLLEAAELGLTKYPQLLAEVVYDSDIVNIIESAGIEINKKKVNGCEVPDYNAYINSEYVIEKGNRRYLTLNEAIDLLSYMKMLKDNPTKLTNILSTANFHTHNELYTKNFNKFKKTVFNNHPGLDIAQKQYTDEPSESLARRVEKFIKNKPRTLQRFVHKASRGFTVNPLNTYIPMNFKNYTSMAQEYMRVLGLDGPNNNIGYMGLVVRINDVDEKAKPYISQQTFKKFKSVIEQGLPFVDWIQNDFASKSAPGGKNPPPPFKLKLPADLSAKELKAMIAGSTAYRNNFILSEFVEAHDWYTDEFMLLDNPNSSHQRKELLDRFVKKYQTLIEMVKQQHKNKTPNYRSWAAGFVRGQHRFLQMYDRVQQNVQAMAEHKDNWISKRGGLYSKLAAEIRKEFDKEPLVLYPKIDTFKNRMVRKYKIVKKQNFNGVWAKFVRGEHNYYNPKTKAKQQEWWYLRQRHIKNVILENLEYLCTLETLPGEQIFTKDRHLPQSLGIGIYFSYLIENTQKLRKEFLEDDEVQTAIEKYRKHYNTITAKSCNTKDIWNTAKAWYETTAPWYVEGAITNTPRNIEKRNDYIKRVLAGKNILVTDKEVEQTLTVLRGNKIPTKKFQEFEIDLLYVEEMIKWNKKRMENIRRTFMNAKAQVDAKQRPLGKILGDLKMNRVKWHDTIKRYQI